MVLTRAVETHAPVFCCARQWDSSTSSLDLDLEHDWLPGGWYPLESGECRSMVTPPLSAITVQIAL